ncbi:MAG: GNAT family N-acetyltransferase [Aminivibrio sp.]|jgi:GNAT superfamily N-acetyltransferase
MNCESNTGMNPAVPAFETALRLWGGLGPCRTEEEDGVLLVSTGCAIADQNYALRTGEGDVKKMIKTAREFFASEGMPFSWWIPPGPLAGAESSLVAGEGMVYHCSPPAMALSLEGREGMPERRDLEFVICGNSSEADEWAAASLEGFGSGPEHLGAFMSFAEAMASGPSADKFRLVTLRSGRAAAGSAMVVLGGDTAGLFYFSITPPFRRQNLGSALLDFVLGEARRAGCGAMALQASPMGAPLYRGAGFADRGAFTVHLSDKSAL